MCVNWFKVFFCKHLHLNVTCEEKSRSSFKLKGFADKYLSFQYLMHEWFSVFFKNAAGRLAAVHCVCSLIVCVMLLWILWSCFMHSGQVVNVFFFLCKCGWSSLLLALSSLKAALARRQSSLKGMQVQGHLTSSLCTRDKTKASEKTKSFKSFILKCKCCSIGKAASRRLWEMTAHAELHPSPLLTRVSC